MISRRLLHSSFEFATRILGFFGMASEQSQQLCNIYNVINIINAFNYSIKVKLFAYLRIFIVCACEQRPGKSLVAGQLLLVSDFLWFTVR